MIAPGQTLGILVNSDKYFEYVLKLAQAATDRGKQVRILVLEKGFGLFATKEFTVLIRIAQITAGAVDMQKSGFREPFKLPDAVKVVSAQQITDILGEFDRTVVF